MILLGDMFFSDTPDPSTYKNKVLSSNYTHVLVDINESESVVGFFYPWINSNNYDEDGDEWYEK